MGFVPFPKSRVDFLKSISCLQFYVGPAKIFWAGGGRGLGPNPTVVPLPPRPPYSTGCGTAYYSVFLCSVYCAFTWAPWSACSASCGSGSRIRYYSITTPARNGGRPCPQPSSEQQACFVAPCPQNPPSKYRSRVHLAHRGSFNLLTRGIAQGGGGGKLVMIRYLPSRGPGIEFARAAWPPLCRR